MTELRRITNLLMSKVVFSAPILGVMQLYHYIPFHDLQPAKIHHVPGPKLSKIRHGNNEALNILLQ